MAAGKLRGLVATASLDLGIDWGDVDLVIQMGAPKGSSRLLQRIGRANHRLDEPSKGILVPGNRFEYLEGPRRARRDRRRRARSRDVPPRRARRARPAHPGDGLSPRRSSRTSCSPRCARPRLMPGSRQETFEEILNFIATGGYALKAYDRFRRLVPEPGGMWRIAKPSSRPAAPPQRRGDRRAAAAHRPLPQRPQARHGRGRLSPRPSRPATTSSSPGLSLEVEQFKDTDIIVHASSKRGADRHLRRAAHVDVDPPRQPRPPHACRPQRLVALSRRRPRMARGAVRALGPARAAPAAGRNLPARRPAFHGRLQLRGLERAPVARHADHQAHGESGAEAARLRRQRLLRSPATGSSRSPTRRRCSPPTSSSRSSSTGSKARYLLKTAFREVAVIGGLVERQHPGQAEDRAAGQLLDRPHLRRAAPLRAAASAAARGLGRCAAADDRARPARPSGRPRVGDHAPRRDRTGSRRWRCR